jgi:hypothetical protein
MKILTALVFISILTVTCFGQSAEAVPFCSAITVPAVSMSGAPSLQNLNVGGSISALVGVTYISHAQGCELYGLVFLVGHNVMSQTIDISTATILLPPGQNVTVSPLVFGFPPDTTLNSTIFMVSFSGVALSSSTIFVFTTF